MTAAAAVAAQPVLSVARLTKTFGAGASAVLAVRGVSLDILPGEVVLVMGPSGSGKTTLLLMLGALLRPTSGSVTVRTAGGVHEVSTAAEHTLPRLRAHTFGFVFQDYALLSALTAEENIAVAANLGGLKGTEAHVRVAHLLDRVGLAGRARARPYQLSGGEQQRVAIARALVNDAPILLADVPTANLDSAHGHDIGRLLRDLADVERRAVVIVSHDERLRDVADRTLWMEDGVLAASSNLDGGHGRPSPSGETLEKRSDPIPGAATVERGSAMQRWPVNISPAERAGRVLIGLAAAVTGAQLLPDAPGLLATALEVLLVLAGLDLVVTGVTGHCPLYQKLGHTPRSRRIS